MVEIRAIHHVSVLVADVTRALEFYQSVLGLQLDDSRPDFDFPGAWLTVGEGQIHLMEMSGSRSPEEAVLHGGRDYHFAMDVVSLDAVVAQLEAAGISYTCSRSGRKALFCRDPDGNALELIEQT